MGVREIAKLATQKAAPPAIASIDACLQIPPDRVMFFFSLLLFLPLYAFT
jgi:hypothetical protein